MTLRFVNIDLLQVTISLISMEKKMDTERSS